MVEHRTGTWNVMGLDTCWEYHVLMFWCYRGLSRKIACVGSPKVFCPYKKVRGAIINSRYY